MLVMMLVAVDDNGADGADDVIRYGYPPTDNAYPAEVAVVVKAGEVRNNIEGRIHIPPFHIRPSSSSLSHVLSRSLYLVGCLTTTRTSICIYS